MFLPNKEVLDAAQTIKKCICMTSVMTQASQAPHTIKEPPQPQDREQSWAVAKTFVRVPVFSNPTLSYLYIYICVYIYICIYIYLSLSLSWVGPCNFPSCRCYSSCSDVFSARHARPANIKNRQAMQSCLVVSPMSVKASSLSGARVDPWPAAAIRLFWIHSIQG